MPISDNKRGILIVFEGCDKVGKSTHCKNLQSCFLTANKKCVIIKLPHFNSKIGKILKKNMYSKEYVDNTFLHLLHTLNKYELNTTIDNLLAEGTNVILDRYKYSGIAYSCALDNLKDFDDQKYYWYKLTQRHLLNPDIIFHLTYCDKNKLNFDKNEKYENIKFQYRVNKWFEKILSEEKNVFHIDTQFLTEKETLKKIINIVCSKFNFKLSHRHSKDYE